MIVLGSWIENNESRVLGIPKQDYLDVLGNILHSEPPVVPATAAHPVGAVHQFPPSRAQRDTSASTDDGDREEEASDDSQSSTSIEEHEVAGKRDSFYFLMKAMQARERRQRRG